MAKDPAFLFYASDFLTGVSGLTMEERGQYITLLCLQHQTGHLSEKEIRLCVGNAAADVLAKFEKDENGKFFNQRLETEINKRKAHSEKQRIRAVEGWEKRKSQGEATANATALPLEDENINRNINNIVIEVKEEKGAEILTPEFERYQDWAARNFPDLLKFDQPLTDQQLQALFDQFKNKTLVREKLEAIGNTKNAKKKYSTVYATCRNWCKLALDRGWKDPTEPSAIGQDVWSRT
jgi:uncharacterized protein YdaU (DUF1376 family)